MQRFSRPEKETCVLPCQSGVVQSYNLHCAILGRMYSREQEPGEVYNLRNWGAVMDGWVHGTVTGRRASGPQCPRDTEDSDQLLPEALSALPNQGRLLESSGLQRAVGDAYWCPSALEETESPEAQQDGDERGNPLGRTDDAGGCSVPHSWHPKRTTRDRDGSSCADLGSEDQEAEYSQSGHALGRAWP
ncbi:hypothetical protein NDU88_010784 [Pleurodeles waltl]|uniref:Uncharacterized protein n=1 Tax=Pleurodeles waltl TaxID=8319 RepID=A0AAV7QVC5_PLEWA|nr:hypothetical protein NDU88_010784 [Pleurodeles waltl]